MSTFSFSQPPPPGEGLPGQPPPLRVGFALAVGHVVAGARSGVTPRITVLPVRLNLLALGDLRPAGQLGRLFVGAGVGVSGSLDSMSHKASRH
jgi:hypothetical protein